MKPQFGIPWGTINVPVGGKLPPAPTYLGTDGKEHKAVFIDITGFDDYPGTRTYTHAIMDTSDWKMWAGSNE